MCRSGTWPVRCSGCRSCSSSPRFPGLHQGVQQAAVNWWFGHNVLGLFYTPLALASVYDFLPEGDRPSDPVLQPVLAGLLGAGVFLWTGRWNHLIGGPVPQWMVTLSIVQSMMMIIPVLAFTVNQYQTLQGHLVHCAIHPPCASFGVGGADVHGQLDPGLV